MRSYKIEMLPKNYKNGHLDGIIMLSSFDNGNPAGQEVQKSNFAFGVSKNSLHFSGTNGDALPPEMGKDSAGNDSELYARIAVAVNALYAGWCQKNLVWWYHDELLSDLISNGQL